ncbi:MAG: cyanoexosortase C [Leptolyngbyaceae cyanobacterium bins.349]|nr:cyanoexosortase C [Leptolyngbyaceae cyanobacterium bins.349]
MPRHRQPESRSHSFWHRLPETASTLLKWSVKNNHTRILTGGLLIGVCFLPTWCWVLWDLTLSGFSTPFFNLAFAYLALDRLWHRRHQLAQFIPSDEEKLVGHLLILGAAIAFPLSQSSTSLQTLICLLIVLGSFYSTWGVSVIRHCGFEICLLLLSLYPDWVFLSVQLWRTLTPANLLENFMAWMGGIGLRTIGQPATANGIYLTLPNGAVEVGPGCSGFDMAFTIVCFTVLLGLFLQQDWFKITWVVLIGIILALIFNIPRIMLLAIAAIYWGQQSFEFWHGPMGGQIFSVLLLTVYYYVAMAFFNQNSIKSSPKI